LAAQSGRKGRCRGPLRREPLKADVGSYPTPIFITKPTQISKSKIDRILKINGSEFLPTDCTVRSLAHTIFYRPGALPCLYQIARDYFWSTQSAGGSAWSLRVPRKAKECWRRSYLGLTVYLILHGQWYHQADPTWVRTKSRNSSVYQGRFEISAAFALYFAGILPPGVMS
jgi:hypothetical protein